MTGKRVAIVTGSNSGIGRASALHLAANDFRVYATVRRPETAGELLAHAAENDLDVEVLPLDVTDSDSVAAAVSAILEKDARIDVLVNNAGVSAPGVVEEASEDAFRSAMEVNFYGALRCIRAVLPAMRAQLSGCLVNVTSLSGRIASPELAPYVASKWALESICEALAFEAALFNVRVAIIEPGLIKTRMLRRRDQRTVTGPYYRQLQRMVSFYNAMLPGAAEASEVAETILHAVTTSEPKLRYLVGWPSGPIGGGRARMTDEEWVGLGGMPTDQEYYVEFERLFGVSIAPEPENASDQEQELA
jgi:NAD(P)-dependent dehydrogenase (short-subunit alcohol dehydrogenase family)